MKLKKSMVMLLFSAFFMLTGCFENKKTESALKTDLKGNTSVNLSLVPAINAGYSIDEMLITLNNDNGEARESSTQVDTSAQTAKITINDLTIGNWNISVKLMENGNEVGYGTGTVVVGAGETASANIVMTLSGGTTGDGTTKVYHLNNTGSFDYELTDLNNSDVYFIFTNTDKVGAKGSPTIADYTDSNVKKVLSKKIISKNESIVGNEVNIQKGKSEISKFNQNPYRYIKKNRSASKNYQIKPQFYAVGEKSNFYDYDDRVIPTTLKKVVSENGKNLYVWVEDKSWTGSGYKSYEINQTIVDALADKFLKSGNDNDIYEWVTNVLGEPWGVHQYDNLIGDTEDIHILLCDIDNDNSSSGGVVGYFYGRDNFKTTTYPDSNEKIMFTVDSVMLAAKEGSSWEIEDYWPEEVISTLAHEFQHMINFYQKFIVNGATEDEDTWLNEMASQCIEDLVAQKIQADGPRGVNYNDSTAGSAGNVYGRLPLYNYWNEKSVFEWNYSNPLPNYSMSYAFGAYLMRNYGGANFIKELVQNNKCSYDAVEYALAQNGYSMNFDTVLQKFGTANLLSDKTNNENNYIFNSGTWNTSTINGTEYNLGSINLYNYVYDGYTGPYIYSSLPASFAKASNTYYRVGENLNGTHKWRIENLDSKVKITVVIKN